MVGIYSTVNYDFLNFKDEVVCSSFLRLAYLPSYYKQALDFSISMQHIYVYTERKGAQKHWLPQVKGS